MLSWGIQMAWVGAHKAQVCSRKRGFLSSAAVAPEHTLGEDSSSPQVENRLVYRSLWQPAVLSQFYLVGTTAAGISPSSPEVRERAPIFFLTAVKPRERSSSIRPVALIPASLSTDRQRVTLILSCTSFLLCSGTRRSYSFLLEGVHAFAPYGCTFQFEPHLRLLFTTAAELN